MTNQIPTLKQMNHLEYSKIPSDEYVTYYDVNRSNIETYILKNDTIINPLLQETELSYENVKLYMSEEKYNRTFFNNIRQYFYHEIETSEVVFINECPKTKKYDIYYDSSAHDVPSKALLKITWEFTIKDEDLFPHAFRLWLINNGEEVFINKFASNVEFFNRILYEVDNNL